jgi:hypothetical protein
MVKETLVYYSWTGSRWSISHDIGILMNGHLFKLGLAHTQLKGLINTEQSLAGPG